MLHYGRGSMVEQTIVNHQPRHKKKVVVTKNGVDYRQTQRTGTSVNGLSLPVDV